MDLFRLMVFCKVYETLSISRAAEILHLTQPGVSKYIKSLEDHYRTPFFFRHGRTLEPTEAGKLFSQFAYETLAKEENIRRLLHNIAQAAQGTISIRATRTIGNYYLPPLIVQFKKLHPKIHLQLGSGDMESICRAIANGEIDLGVLMTRGTENLVSIPLGEERLVLVASPDHPLVNSPMPVAKSELSRYPFVAPYRGTWYRGLTNDLLRKWGLDWSMLQVEIEINDVEPTKRLVESGHALAFLLYSAVRREIEMNLLTAVQVDDVPLTCEYSIVYRENFLSPAAAAFVDFLLGATAAGEAAE